MIQELETGRDVIRFVDLCAGLGGFHRGLALAQEAFSQNGGPEYQFECVLASELDDELRRLYVSNFPEIEATYRKLFPPDETAAVVNSLQATHKELSSGVDLYNGEGQLLRIHGDLNSLVDADHEELRRRPNGEAIIPEHELLCAGFPCQPFSKSGGQRGFEDTRGTLFYLLALVIRHRRPDLLFLENVGNFERHDEGNTWSRVKGILDELGYAIRATEHVGSGKGAAGLLSPHHIGYPHRRERFFIVAQRRESSRFPVLKDFPFPFSLRLYRTSSEHRERLERDATKRLVTILTKKAEESDSPREIQLSQLSKDRLAAVEHWGKLLSRLQDSDRKHGRPEWQHSMPSFPIWGYELDPWQWYPIDGNPAGYRQNLRQLATHRVTTLELAARELHHRTAERVDLYAYPPHGDRAFLMERELTPEDARAWMATWPGYAGQRNSWPVWKRRFIEQSRDWGLRLWSHLDPEWLRQWIDDLFRRFPAASHQKLEWNCKGADLEITQHIIQFRPSGIRVQRLRHIPALVAMTTTQVPVVPTALGSEGLQSRQSPLRHLLPSEALRLQGFPADWKRPKSRERTFNALGNAVHAQLVSVIVNTWLSPTEEECPQLRPNCTHGDQAEFLLLTG